MKNRWIAWTAMVVMGFVTVTVTATAEDYMEGVEYTRISKPMRTVAEPGTIEVREYFWYGCPHCNNLEPFLQRWLDTNPKNISLKVQPTIFRENWAPAAQAFYTAGVLGVLDKTHHAMFDAIHNDNRKNLLGDDLAMEVFFEEHGVAPADFRKAWGSFSVQSRVKQAVRMTRKSGIKGVPAVVVNGKYVTDPGIAGGYREMFKVIEYLVAKEMASNH